MARFKLGHVGRLQRRGFCRFGAAQVRLGLQILCLLFLPCLAVQAGEIVVAQVAPKTGPLGPNGIGNYIGAKAVFDDVNARGGIHGQKIRFVYEDDKYQPAETIRLLNLVGARDRPVLFVNLLGSANVAAVLKDQTLEKLGVPAVGVTPGVESLRSPGSPLIFHTQAGDKLQLERAVAHLSTVGIESLGVVYQDNPFGHSGLAYVEDSAKRLGLKLLGRVAVKVGADDLNHAAVELKATNAQAYIMVLASNSGAAFVRDVRNSGDRTLIYGMSYVSVADVIEKAGAKAAEGVALTQVTPNTFSEGSGIVRSFRALMLRQAPKEVPTQLNFIGYLAARAAVDALQRAGTSITPATVANALKAVRIDENGYTLDFTKGNIGSSYVNIGMIDRRGRLVF